MNVSIHQIFYDDSQRASLDPAFMPYDNRSNEQPEWREYHVFRTEYLAGRCREGCITGYVSWKFGMKTRVPGSAFVAFIERHPGHDVYFLNPRGLERGSYRNVWLQGEFHHPGILGLARRIFREADIDVDPARLEQPRSQVLYCNYWAGSRRFWDAYMAFCEPVRHVLLHGLSEDDRRLLRSRADKAIDACFIPFIMERLFSTLLTLRPDISFRGWDGSGARTPRANAWYGRLFGLDRPWLAGPTAASRARS
jgi:hypothetical protein